MHRVLLRALMIALQRGWFSARPPARRHSARLTVGREEHRERHDRCLVDHGRERGMKVSTVDASSVVGHVKNGES